MLHDGLYEQIINNSLEKELDSTEKLSTTVALLSPRREQRTATPTAQGFVWLLRTVIKASISGLRR